MFVSTDKNFTSPPGCFCLQIRKALQDVSVYRSEKPSRMFLCTDQNFTTGPLGCFCLETRILRQALQDVSVNRSEKPSRMFLSTDQKSPPGCFCLQIRKALQAVSVYRSEFYNRPSWMRWRICQNEKEADCHQSKCWLIVWWSLLSSASLPFLSRLIALKTLTTSFKESESQRGWA